MLEKTFTVSLMQLLASSSNQKKEASSPTNFSWLFILPLDFLALLYRLVRKWRRAYFKFRVHEVRI